MGYNVGVNKATATADKERTLRAALVVRAIGWLAVVVFILAIPTFLVTSNVRWGFNSLRLYRYGFEQYNVVRTTGLDMGQLMEVAREIRDYFNSSAEFLDVNVTLGGVQRPLFNQGEVLHMRDVKGLVQGVYRAQEVAGAYILAYLLLGLLASRGRLARRLAGHVLLGSALAIGLVLLIGLGAVAGFDRLFEQFHVLGFSNDLWRLDPRFNYLTRLFTQGFFFQATLFIALAVVLQALLLATMAWAIRRMLKAGG